MIAGVPGTGLGGVFYLLCALCMPLYETARILRGRSDTRWGVVAMQFGLAVGIFGGMWLTGWLLGLVLIDVADIMEISPGQSRWLGIFSIAPFVIAVVVLGTLLLAVEWLHIALRRKTVPPKPTAQVVALPPPASQIEPKRRRWGGR